MKFSKTEGRHLVAKQKILPGDVLIVDTPYITSLFHDYQDTHCHYCFKRLDDNYVPSPVCDKVSLIIIDFRLITYSYFFIINSFNKIKVKFCCAECLGICYHETHKYEGGLLHIIDSPDIGRMATLAYRSIKNYTL